MRQNQTQLYPRFSSIYNKIMQLAIAVFMLLIVLNLWVYSFKDNKLAIEQHFANMAAEFLTQTANTVSVIGLHQREQLSPFIAKSLADHPWLKDISIYDETGQLLIASDGQQPIKALFGLTHGSDDQSEHFQPFITEIRDEKLHGYVRVTIAENGLTQLLTDSSAKQFDLSRLMLILAGVIGFLLTRGLNRFSRQGFRLARK